jgi:hypothetical protein
MKLQPTLAVIPVLFFCALLSPLGARAEYVAHEWGTFTSVQGGDGELIPWRPLQTSELPAFVHNWNQAGLNRLPSSPMFFTKGEMVTLQRMETPVIYFYANAGMTLDVGVDFPKGTITEWYPQATQIGPSVPRTTNAPAVTTTRESRAVWKNLKLVTSVKNKSALNDLLPQDKSGSHYFAARETASAFVQSEFSSGASNAVETEKFIFYRGAGSFKTPLRVSVNAANDIAVENTGGENVSHLFLIRVHDSGHGKTGALAAMNDLPAKKSARWAAADPLPLDEFQTQICTQMEQALVAEGLFPKEARAMVNTWRDSWFTEEGDRVLYILPRAWTDETLPLRLNPRPAKLVRVMVGRAEILTPKTEKSLSDSLVKAANGGGDERKAAARELKSLGRFAEPALRLARLDTISTNAFMLSYQLLSEIAMPSQSAPSKFE